MKNRPPWRGAPPGQSTPTHPPRTGIWNREARRRAAGGLGLPWRVKGGNMCTPIPRGAARWRREGWRAVRREERDGDARGGGPRDHVVGPQPHGGGRAEGGLVEHEQPGLRHDPARDRQHLALAAAERARRGVEPLAQDRKE